MDILFGSHIDGSIDKADQSRFVTERKGWAEMSPISRMMSRSMDTLELSQQRFRHWGGRISACLLLQPEREDGNFERRILCSCFLPDLTVHESKWFRQVMTSSA